jgi:glycerol transport system ATP-binding protein
MIYVTHDQTEALTFADKVVVMHDGFVVQIGTPEDLFTRPAHTFVGHFIGSPGMNVLPCRIEGTTAHVEGGTIALARAYPSLPGGARIELGVRPEFATVRPKGSGLAVRLRRVDDLGRVRIARVEMMGLAMAATIPDSVELSGEEASLVLDSSRVHVYADGHLVAGETIGAAQ